MGKQNSKRAHQEEVITQKATGGRGISPAAILFIPTHNVFMC
jgi:hypothetical protein